MNRDTLPPQRFDDNYVFVFTTSETQDFASLRYLIYVETHHHASGDELKAKQKYESRCSNLPNISTIINLCREYLTSYSNC